MLLSTEPGLDTDKVVAHKSEYLFARCVNVLISTISYEADASFSTEPGFNTDKPVAAYKSKTGGTFLPPLPSPPSLLLCPSSCRTFLASLNLASKFMQDR